MFPLISFIKYIYNIKFKFLGHKYMKIKTIHFPCSFGEYLKKNATSCLSHLAATFDLERPLWPEGLVEFIYEICDQNYIGNDTSHDETE